MKWFVGALLMAVACITSATQVVFVNPSIPGTPFWDRVTAAAKAAAEDLSIDLKVVYGRDNRIFNLEAIQKVIATGEKPDYLLFMPYDGNAEATFNSLQRAEIPFITLERTLQPEEQELVGFPQEKYSYWLGEIYHDNLIGGQRLADALISAAKAESNKEHYIAIGISGSFSGESSDRVSGLELSISKHRKVNLAQVVPAIWSRERSRNIIHQLTTRFGKVDIAWAASDGMALGVMDSIQSGHGDINKEMKIGGIDWTVEAIKEVGAGNLTASVGGHFMQAAWALVKIHDHVNGHSVFLKGDHTKTYDLEVIAKNNIDRYQILANKVNWHRVDFKQFTLPKSNGQYDFSFERVLKQFD